MEPHHQYNIHVDTSGHGGGGGGGGGDRFPQWSLQETRDFLTIRSELDPTFMETKRNKLLWEVIATRMREKGYNRSAEQCKSKWKNLITRYKGCETMEHSESSRQQFPFYNELQSILAARIQRMLWMEADGGTATGSKQKAVNLSSDDDDENEETSDDVLLHGSYKGAAGSSSSMKKKRKIKGGGEMNVINPPSSSGGGENHIVKSLKEIMEEFMKQRMEMEMEWLKAYEAREEERKRREIEWRQRMEALENERLMMERRWREREEQRKVREEARAEKRDALITILLNKLTKEE